ncbi:MAG: radical SAM protein, partial [Candidatus Fermentibacteraceae bacterium]|nr:radical SAM protein [Candidatus Fermentibacteraceae bacterium]
LVERGLAIMHCPAVDSVFLRANGSFVCWDDAGSDHILTELSSESGTSWLDILENTRSYVAQALRDDRLPDPSVCPGCYCLSAVSRGRFDPLSLDVVQVEPSARCDLRCVACATTEERDRLSPPLDLSPAVFRRILEDLGSRGMTVNTFDFSGHGEPLKNPRLFTLTSMARKFYPGTFITVCTNGQGEFNDEVLTSGIDQVQVAVDGIDQESYGKYRVGGDFRMAWNYLSGLSAHSSRIAGTRAVWRYILFSHNSSPWHLERVWKMAADAGVDEVRFIFTHRGPWSENIQSGSDLVRILSGVGVPGRSLRIDTLRSLKMRSRLRDKLKTRKGIHSILRRTWNGLRAGRRGPTSLPFMTTDFCRLDIRELRRFARTAIGHARRGRTGDALDILRHVERLADLPARHNRSYRRDEMIGSLGKGYDELKCHLGAVGKMD